MRHPFWITGTLSKRVTSEHGTTRPPIHVYKQTTTIMFICAKQTSPVIIIPAAHAEMLDGSGAATTCGCLISNIKTFGRRAARSTCCHCGGAGGRRSLAGGEEMAGRAPLDETWLPRAGLGGLTDTSGPGNTTRPSRHDWHARSTQRDGAARFYSEHSERHTSIKITPLTCVIYPSK